MVEQLKALIFDIQAYSIHDGPGCRTVVFLGGCPLQFDWCSNPEGQKLKQSLLFNKDKCKHINYRCIEACHESAISFSDKENDLPVFDLLLCNKCDNPVCIEACMFEALNLSGKYYSSDNLMKNLRRDQGFWGEKGGVTFTGGEPFLQYEFLIEILKECQLDYIHTAIETSAYVDINILKKAMKFIDIKHMNNVKHKAGTGVGNDKILKNIEFVSNSEWDGRLIIRFAIIPGYNDSKENMLETAEFMNKNNLTEINILPFHRLGSSKYQQLGRVYSYKDILSPSQEDMLIYKSYFENSGISCYVDFETPF